MKTDKLLHRNGEHISLIDRGVFKSRVHNLNYALPLDNLFGAVCKSTLRDIKNRALQAKGNGIDIRKCTRIKS